MKHLNNFEEFNESKLTKYALGAAALGATIWGANKLANPNKEVKVRSNQTELVHFPEFSITTLGFDNNIDVSINEVDTTIGVKTRHGKRTRYTITVDESVDVVYYKVSTFGEYIYATSDKTILPGSKAIHLSDLEVVEETNSYKILRYPSFFSGLDFILVNKGYQNTKNEFEINGQRYSYFEKSFGFLEGHASFVVKH